VLLLLAHQSNYLIAFRLSTWLTCSRYLEESAFSMSGLNFLASDAVANNYNLKVPTPTLDPLPGNHDANSLAITVACGDAAGLYYTIDGTDPEEGDSPIAGLDDLATSTQLKVRAFKAGCEPSDVAGGQYNLYWWQAVGGGVDGTVNALAYDGTGSLYAGGNFNNAGGGAASKIAKWSAGSWSSVGAGFDETVYSLAIGNDGALYAGGNFNALAGGGDISGRIAKWSAGSWSSLGAGFDGDVYSLAIGSDGALYAGGSFANAGGVACNHIAKWGKLN